MHDGKMCRSCLSTNRQVVSLMSYMPFVTPRRSHLECLCDCTQLEISVDTGNYPVDICLRCSQALQVAYHFIMLTRESEGKLMRNRTELLDVDMSIDIPTTDAMEIRKQNDIKEFYSPAKWEAVKATTKQFSTHFADYVANATQDMVVSETKLGSGDEVFNFEMLSLLSSKDFNSENAVEASPENICRMDLKNVMHRNEKPYTFIALSATINQAEPLKEHKPGTFASNLVDEITENPQNVHCNEKPLQTSKTSQDSRLDVAKFMCNKCNRKFHDMTTYKRHLNHHNGITPFRCSMCNFFTCYSESLRKHYKKEHNIEATNGMLNIPIDPIVIPMEKPYNEISYKCKICGYQNLLEDDLEAHITHEHLIAEEFNDYITKVYNCSHCYRSFKDQKSLSTHFTLMHGTSQGIKKVSTDIFTCEYCEKQFKFRTSLRLHQRVCRMHEKVSCNICKKKFETMRKFESHLRAEHDVETIYECEVCSKTFNNPGSLSMHRKRHTERHFQCDLCPRNYINSSELRVHIERMHGTKAKVTCRTCGMHFTQTTLLRAHENKEHFAQYYNCLYCDFQSTTSCNVRLHQYKHTGKPYQCEICGKEFSLRSKLRCHAKTVHSVELTDEHFSAMFRKKFGYPSRYDAFSKANNSLEITEVSEEDIALELNEYGLNFNDIMKDLFGNE